MVDREKVIKNLEELLVFSRYNDSVEWNPYNDTETLEDALALLKEQEPRTALNIIKVHEGTLGNCPTCGAELINYYNETHCGRCGQAVKWG